MWIFDICLYVCFTLGFLIYKKIIPACKTNNTDDPTKKEDLCDFDWIKEHNKIDSKPVPSAIIYSAFIFFNVLATEH